jgi:hypothetical protein
VFSRRPVTQQNRGRVSTSVGAAAPATPVRHLHLQHFIANGTFTPPANFVAPDGTAGKVKAFGRGGGGGGTVNTGAGGGGAAANDNVDASAGVGIAIVIGTSAGNANGGDTTVGETLLVAKGGKSGANGGIGGLASESTGTNKFDGGNGGVGTGSQSGGASAGHTSAASGITPGQPDGAFGAGNSVGTPGCGGNSTAGAGVAGGRGDARIEALVEALAGHPRLLGYTVLRDSAAGTTRDIVLPAGSGGRLLVVVFCDSTGSPTITMDAAWTAFAQQTDPTGGSTTQRTLHLDASGGDPAALTITTSASKRVLGYVFRVADCAAPLQAVATFASATNHDPPDLPFGGTVNALVFTLLALDQSAAAFVTGAPTDFTLGHELCPFAINEVRVALAWRFVTGVSSINPSAWGHAAESGMAMTLGLPGV